MCCVYRCSNGNDRRFRNKRWPLYSLPVPTCYDFSCSYSTERADALGKLGVSYGVGMVTGPFVGGYVTTYFSEQNAAMVAAGLCVIAIVTVVLMVPASTKSRESAMEQERQPQKDNGRGTIHVRPHLS